MINKEEISRNIQSLLKGYADSSNDIKVTVRTAKEVDVYIDGELFNTYLIDDKKFKNNIVSLKNTDDEFRITIILSRTDLAETMPQYKGAELQLPATENEIQDAYQRARIKDENQSVILKTCKMYDTEYSENQKADISYLQKLNYLAKVMSRFSIYEHKQFRGYMQKKNLSLSDIDSLINIAYNLNGCEVIEGIYNAEALGRMYADNGMLEWMSEMPKEAWDFLDYAAIGEKLKAAQDGIFTDDGYFTCNDREFNEVYDGITFPEVFDDDRYIFKLYIASKNTEAEKWLSLPVSKEGKANFLKELECDSFDDCTLLAVQSMESDIPMCVRDLSQLGLLNSLAHRMRDMEKAGELAKFKAVLSGFGCDELNTAIEYANRMQDFVLFPDASSVIEYAKERYKTEFGSTVPERFAKYFNFAAYSVDLAENENIAVTEYGVIKDVKGKHRDEKS